MKICQYPLLHWWNAWIYLVSVSSFYWKHIKNRVFEINHDHNKGYGSLVHRLGFVCSFWFFFFSHFLLLFSLVLYFLQIISRSRIISRSSTWNKIDRLHWLNILYGWYAFLSTLYLLLFFFSLPSILYQLTLMFLSHKCLTHNGRKLI